VKLVTEYAMQFIGVPYVWGGSNPMRGFDCSGFVQFVLESVGADPKGDQTCQSLHDLLLMSGGITLPTPKAGALCFYGKAPKALTHVSLCLNQYQIIEAGGGDSSTTSVVEAAKRDACVRVRPVDRRKDLITYVMPNYPTWVING